MAFGFYGQSLEVEYELIFPTLSRILSGIFIYIFYIFLVSVGCGGSSLVTVPFITKVGFFPLFFFSCDFSRIIKCCDCFGRPSMGIYPTHKYRSSSPELCFHSGRVVKVCSVMLWGKQGTQMGSCFGRILCWLFSKTQILLLRSIKICLLTLKIHSSPGISICS